MDRIEGIAQAILDGFDRHYRLFREISAAARGHFQAGDWQQAWEDNGRRIRMYEQRVRETVGDIEECFPEAASDYQLWPRVKRAYIGLLLDHLQPECAETFYNSVACRVLHRRYYRNEYIFWRPALNTDNLEGTQDTYRSYYPAAAGLRRCLLELLTGAGLGMRFEDLRRDVRNLERALGSQRSELRSMPNHQLQVLSALFFRNKAAYLVGRQVDGERVRPLIIPILHNEAGEVYVDTVLTRTKDAAAMFSFTRAYFMVDMEVPSACVSFLLSIMPGKSRVDLYSILGLQKHAKTLFYRELHHHLNHSTDNFSMAPGIPGTVMLVFTLPSFPFVLKIIKDRFDPPKSTNREHVRACYDLVKFHDRVGRLADTLEYSQVAIPLNRIDPELLQEMRRSTAESIETDGELLVIRHCYIERRMIPLNQFLAAVTGKQRRRVIDEYGKAIRELAGANIFPGDMMQKNFGVTRLGRVVFYDYDEICYLSDCRFRYLPEASEYHDELAAEPWFSIFENDVFPETFGSFFFPDQAHRDLFLRKHAALLEPRFWQNIQETIRAGQRPDVFPYSPKLRFGQRFPAGRRPARRDAA